MEVVETNEEVSGGQSSAEGNVVTPVAAEKVPSGVVKINGATVEEFTQVVICVLRV